jgi:hypothetical protein
MTTHDMSDIFNQTFHFLYEKFVTCFNRFENPIYTQLILLHFMKYSQQLSFVEKSFLLCLILLKHA